MGVERHELNRHFEWRPHAGPFRVISAAQAASYDELGYFVLPAALPREVIDKVVAAIDPFEARLEEKLRELGGRFSIARADEITFSPHLVTRSAALREFVMSPVLVGLCADLIGPDVRLYWDQAVYKKPNVEASFPWHQDNGYTFTEPQDYLTCWIPLSDATVDNGCPWVVPGLHKMGTLAHRPSDTGQVCLDNPTTAVPVPAQAGDIVVFSSITPHSTGPNLTADVRKAYIVQYAPEGAMALRRDGDQLVETPLDDPSRQFPVLREGDPV